jgi:hypothetical protein
VKGHVGLFAGAIVLAVAATTGPSLADQRVSVTANGCLFTGAKSVRVFMDGYSASGPFTRHIHVPAAEDTSGALRFEFLAPPGDIFISYAVDGQPCMSVNGGLVVLPGYDRHVLVSMKPMYFFSDWSSRKFVAGVMPATPVSLVVSNTSGCPDSGALEIAATIDGGAYYVGNALGRHMFLKLRSATAETLYLALPDATPADNFREYVRRDITQDDLRMLASGGPNDRTHCVLAPSGSAAPFP